MKFNEDFNTGNYHLRRYGDGWIQINDKRLTTGFILTPAILIETWEPEKFNDLRVDHLQPALAIQAEIILIGTGKNQQLPTADIHRTLVQQGTGFEIMSTDAACRTYNVLTSEDRSVTALLFPL